MTSTPNQLPLLSALRSKLAYDPLSGALCRKIPVDTLSVMVDGRRYQAARLCYALGHGLQLIPDQKVIHLNGDRRDTRLDNLVLDPPIEQEDSIDITLRLYGAVWG